MYVWSPYTVLSYQCVCVRARLRKYTYFNLSLFYYKIYSCFPHLLPRGIDPFANLFLVFPPLAAKEILFAQFFVFLKSKRDSHSTHTRRHPRVLLLAGGPESPQTTPRQIDPSEFGAAPYQTCKYLISFFHSELFSRTWGQLYFLRKNTSHLFRSCSSPWC